MTINIEQNKLNIREKVTTKGLESATTPELMALIIKSGAKNLDALKLSQHICRQYSSIHEMSFSNLEELKRIKHIGLAKACQLSAAFELGRRINQKNSTQTMTTPKSVLQEVSHLKQLHQEHLVGLFLNARNQLISKRTLAIGDLNHASINPREIFAQALQLPCLGIILVHNHPSGQVSPSPEDLEFTKQIANGCRLLGLFLLDHIIVAGDDWVSMSEKDLI